jgi:hypothetical protein
MGKRGIAQPLLVALAELGHLDDTAGENLAGSACPSAEKAGPLVSSEVHAASKASPSMRMVAGSNADASWGAGNGNTVMASFC